MGECETLLGKLVYLPFNKNTWEQGGGWMAELLNVDMEAYHTGVIILS